MPGIERAALLTILVAWGCGCGGGDDDDQTVDASAPGPDAADVDASAEIEDASVADAPAPADALVHDAPVTDAEPPDAASADAASADAEPPDAEPPDAESPDAEPPDAEPPDAEPADAEPPDAEPLDAPLAVPTAFRPDSLVLRDPHTFLWFGSCADITDDLFFGMFSANSLLDDAVTGDNDNPPDGLLDLSLLAIFRPLNQGLADNPGELALGDCTVPMNGTSCDLAASPPPESTTFTNVAVGVCSAPHANTTSGYSPSVAEPTDNCFYSGQVNMTIPFLGASLTFENADVAAEYVGDPATGMVNILIRGFMSEADAQNTDVDLPFLGATPLSRLLAGSPDACSSVGDDRDLGPDGVTLGWWFYFNGTGVEVSYTGP